MSRTIHNDHPWTDSEIAYQLSRGRTKEVKANQKDFPRPAEIKLDPDVFKFVKELDQSGLEKELKNRGLAIQGREKDLKLALAQAIQAEREN